MTDTPDPAEDEPIEVEFEPAKTSGKSWKTLVVAGGLAILLLVALGSAGWVGWQRYATSTARQPATPSTLADTTATPGPNTDPLATNQRPEYPNHRTETPDALADSLDSLAGRVARLESTYTRTRSALTTRAQALADLNRSLARLTDRIERLETASSDLNNTPTHTPGPNPPLVPPASTDIAPASPLVAPAPPSDTDNRLALRLGLTALDAALVTNAPFERVHDLIANLDPNDDTIAALGPVARNGAPLWSELEAKLDTYRDSQTAQIHANDRKNKTLWQKILDSFIRFHPQSNTTQTTLDNATSALLARDIDRLETALASHSTSPEIASLIDQARRRALADRAAASIRTRLRNLDRPETSSTHPSTHTPVGRH